MKFKLNLVTLALLANAGFVSTAMAAGGYGIQDANTDKVKFDKWACKRCVVETGVNGTVGVGMGYNNSDDIRSANAFAAENDLAAKLDADLKYVSESGYRATIEADNLGMENGRLDINAGKSGQYNLNLNYRQIATYKTDSAMSPYQGVGGDHLTLPDNWQTAGSSQDMTQLYSSLNPMELSLKRKRAGLGFDYTFDADPGEELWTTYLNYQRENKTGLKQASGSFYNQSMMLAEPVDYTTDTVEAGIKLKGDNWFTALNYSGSSFKNQYSQLTFDNAFNPTFGAQTQGTMALDPDNEAHTVSLMGRVTADKTILSGRVHYGQMTQDQAFVTSGYGYQMPAESLDGRVDMTGVNLKLVSRLNRSVSIKASYDYSDRDNKTNVEEWTQISIDSTTGQAAYNTPYDITTQRAKLSANYRITRGMRLEAGYDYRQDDRSYQDRETTNEHTLWSKFRLSKFENWDMWIKGSYGERDGSEYQASEWTSNESNDLLRKYNLADRKRTMVEARITHSPTEALTIDLGTRYALDDYNDTQIGLTESRDLSYDVSASYLINDDMTLTAFYNRQNIESDQSGSTNFSTPNWFGVVEDQVDVIGAGWSYNNLMEKKLRLGVDYTYSNSDSNTQVTQGVTGDYGDYYAKSHNINIYGQYQATEKMALRLDYKMEKYQDNDAGNEIAPDGIWNVVSFGSNSHDYTAHLIMLSMSYRL
ncbi:MtrB/PioB family decaheme-associated outer membrane protein [Shewanella sp. YLB-07]|uniref:MtrB/PioB family decaheme-associated outer membrane protein n=1 Tax=Shewanella sp. YLB-07 TaxID=2601268 RepID=UPI00128E7ECB|nr:MtrB/PioB family decaheme-associated outer membrane protein [Shewanella sp. YLB-07]MPY21423.1 MtrB/PioB family decaheme-associated outer membrane protein [Shewanella sp. YLB-07]MPY22210.1 MtrB/PioB family decaheme-associated outer membrane protein [Shewanella sp. YLB-07]